MARAIDQILLRDIEERYAPPSMPCLSLSLVGDVVFLTTVEMNATHKEQTQKTIASVAVTVDDLLNAIAALKAGKDHDA